jgi:hypothetical protein
VRTHALRGTWQLLAPEDVRWVLDLVAPNVLARTAKRERDLDLDAETSTRGQRLLARAVRDGAHRTRAELTAALAEGGVAATGPRLGQLLLRAELEQVLCSGRQRGAQITWAAFDDRVPSSPRLPRAEAARRLGERFFTSRAPATVDDFLWWSGLPPAEARAACEGLVRPAPAQRAGSKRAWLLPAFDEFLISYADRSAVIELADSRRVNGEAGLLGPCVVLGGRVVGGWRRELRRGVMAITVRPFGPLTDEARAAITTAAEHTSRFEGLACDLRFGSLS